MNYYKELLQLRRKYNQLLFDHKHPIDMNTDEHYILKGYDEALERVVRDLTDIINQDEYAIKEKEKFAYTE